MLEAQITIPTERDGVALVELTEQLEHFRALYIIAYGELARVGGDLDVIDEDHVRTVSERMRQFPHTDDWPLAVSFFGRREFDPEWDITIYKINRTNPIELLVAALAGPLAVAVILSGGQLKIGGMLEVKLQPIGVGIKKLREALKGTTAGEKGRGRRPGPRERS